MSEVFDRRKLLGVMAVAAVGIPLAECTQQQVLSVEAYVTSAIQKAQTGVVAAMQAACAAAGKLVPTADTVMQEVVTLLNSTVAQALAGNQAAAIAAVAGAVQGTIDNIVAAGCPKPSPSPAPSFTATAPEGSLKTAKGTVIKFY